MVKLNIGGAGTKIAGFKSVDLYHPAADIHADCADTGFAQDQVDEIFCSHMVEHIEPDHFEKTLGHWFWILKSGGKLTILTPNAIVYVREWLAAAEENNIQLLDGWARRNMLGWEGKGEGMWNRNMFTSYYLKQLVIDAGFKVDKCVATETRVKNKGHFEYREQGDIHLIARKD
jgi:SAM-dependent methyltransferase